MPASPSAMAITSNGRVHERIDPPGVQGDHTGEGASFYTAQMSEPPPDGASKRFELVSDFVPMGDQPRAIEELVDGLERGLGFQTMQGATGTGKTFTMANIIAQRQVPTLVLAPNRTLAAQLASEFREMFPTNAVEYFVSYYDYYQPEAYIPRSDTYIAKDADINEEIDKMRHAATRALFERRDVLIVASVSCIYGLGEPSEYYNFVLKFKVGETANRARGLR